MPRMCVRLVVAFLLVMLAAGGLTLAEETGFSGGVGLEITFIPIPPLSYDIEADLTLSLSIACFTFESETVFALTGFQSQEFDVEVDLGAVSIAEEIIFDPYFSWNQLSVDALIIAVETGLDLILADIGIGTQSPSYSMGAVLELSSGVMSGFSITTLTGFGAIDLVNVLGGVEAPFSHNLLDLFSYLDSLFAPQFTPRVTIVPGFYFEEEFVRLEVDYCGLLSSSSTWLDWTGFAKEVFEFGYQFEEPSLSFLTAMTFDNSFSISGLDFILDLEICGVQFTSWTSFTAPQTPSVLPIVFSGQRFAVSFEVFGVLVTAETDFDGTFLFERQLLAIEAEIEPVAFTSLTAFDKTGFSGEWIKAQVRFSGVTLYTLAAFDFGGVIEVSFGFELAF
ncbi:hypothetical protein KAU37_08010 [Candidatus Bipolaricaulota bacterium]|nr:hypothetical protein [Candidatus Bipolaricaulota bacterium]